MSIATLALYADLYGTTPHALIHEAWTRIPAGSASDGYVNLADLVVDTTPALAPLRAWATARLRDPSTSAAAAVELNHGTLMPLAEICGMTPLELAATLSEFHNG